MEFLQSFLRCHFVGKPCSGGVAKCRLLFHAKCNFVGTIESVCMLKKRYFSVLIVYLSCLVPWPPYSTRPKRFGSRGPSEDVSMAFPSRSPRIRHRVVREGLGKRRTGTGQLLGNSLRLFSSLSNLIPRAFPLKNGKSPGDQVGH